MIEWKEALRWKADNMPESTEAIAMVSNTGEVKRLSYKRWNSNNNGYSNIKEILYKQSSNRGKKKSKYLSIRLKDKTYSVHRLVALAFIPNPDNKETVNHKDFNHQNNNVNNLEWMTRNENYFHGRENNRFPVGAFMSLNDEQKAKIIQLRLYLHNTKEIGEIVNLSHETVRNFLNINLENERDIRYKQKSFVKFVSSLESSARLENNKIRLKHGTIELGRFNNIDDALIAKNKYIVEKLGTNNILYERWNALWEQ